MHSNHINMVMENLGIYDDHAGRYFLTKHFNNDMKTTSNIIKRFSNKHGNYEVRESLFFGPSGKSVLLETTYQIMPDGTRVFNTTIPKGSAADIFKANK